MQSFFNKTSFLLEIGRNFVVHPSEEKSLQGKDEESFWNVLPVDNWVECMASTMSTEPVQEGVDETGNEAVFRIPCEENDICVV